MLVCYTRIAHNLTQATVCCGESAGQFTCVGGTGAVDINAARSSYRVGPNKAVHVHWSDVLEGVHVHWSRVLDLKDPAHE